MTAPIRTTPSTTTPQNIPLGIGMMVLAVLLFSLNDTLGKWLAGYYAAPQILLFRSFSAILVLAPLVGRLGFRALFQIERPRLQVMRALLGGIETGLFYLVVKFLPLADAMTFYLAGPIYVTVLAAVFLGEKVGWRRWTAVLVGFAGVVIALQPAASHFGWQAGLALLGSIMYAVFLTVTRSLRRTPDAVMAFWQIGSGLFLGLLGTPFVFVPFARWYDVALLALLGVVALGAIVCVNRSLKLAPASVVVPYQYLLIVWAVIFGYVFFGDVPAPATLAGALVIVGAGLFIFIREQKLALPSEPEMPPEL
jgi:drug/metabolite transporter (DMT)-like permease